MSKEVVELPRLPNDPQWNWAAKLCGSLDFTGLELAHAVVKTDFLDQPNPLLPGIGFVLQSERFIDWGSTSFALRDGASGLFSDFVKNSLIGRIGQGMSVLFAQSRGYAFVAHLSAFLAGRGIQVQLPSGGQLAAADFVCENSSEEVAVFESKASAKSGPNETSRTKSLLKTALRDQVNPWLDPAKVPRVKKGYVVCSYLRERSDPEGSTIVFVDPEVEMQVDEPEGGETSIRRRNYAAWLMAMGLDGPARRLLHGRGRPEFHTFDIVKVGDVEIALLAACAQWSVPEREGGILTAGISFQALKAIEASNQGFDLALLQLESLVPRGRDARAPYSLFPDGTYFGDYPMGQLTGETEQVYI